MATSISRPRPSSILLQSYLPLQSNALSSPVCSVYSHTSQTPKHIRFAPLPEPDRDHLQTDNISTKVCDPDPPQLILPSSISSSSSSQLSSPTTSSSLLTPQCDTYSPNSSVGSSPIIQSSTLPSKCSSINTAVIAPNFIDTTNINNPDSSSSSEPSPRWIKKPHIFLLRPFKRSSTSSSASSSHTLTPTPSIENRKKRSNSTEQILTLGAVNLFRPPSRESSRSARTTDSSTWGLDLSRWPSLGGSNSNIPLTRTQSTQSHKSKSSSILPTFPSSSSSSLSSDCKMKAKANPTPLAQQSAANRRKGTRMLNGRVYGGPKKNTKANPFANARDEEPEFVEWGYGGMGSVKGARSAGVSSNWERLQGGSAMGDGAKTRLDVGVGGRGASDGDMDDGSGLAWVKRRREERERKAREQKEKEEKEAEKENSSQNNTPIPTRSSTLESIATLSSPTSDIEPTTHTPPTLDVTPLTIVLEEDGETATRPDFPTPVPSRYPSELGVSSSSYSQNPLTEEPANADQSKPEEGQLHNSATTHENERILQAITIPVRSPRHHHHRQPSKATSREVLISPLADALQVGSPIFVSPNAGVGDTMDASTSLLHTSTINSIDTDKAASPTSFSSSFEESESESEEADDGDDEDEDEDEEESQKQSERMKTTLGTAAGVEKISRHKE